MPLDDCDPVFLEILQSGYEAVVIPGNDNVYIVQIGLGEIEKLLAIRRTRHRENDIEFLFSELVFHGAEVRELDYLETCSELVANDVKIVGDDSNEMSTAVLELVGRIIGFGADTNDRMR